MAWVPAQDDMAWKRASTGRGSMPPQKTSFEPHARQPDSFRKPRQGDLILFSQISSIRNEGRHELVGTSPLHFSRNVWLQPNWLSPDTLATGLPEVGQCIAESHG